MRRSANPFTAIIGSLILFSMALLFGCAQPSVNEMPNTAARPTQSGPLRVTRPQILPLLPSSRIQVEVGTAGKLAAFGHRHLISILELQGVVYLAPDLSASGFYLVIPVDKMRVDDPEQRQAHGPQTATPIEAEAIAGTRANMLGGAVLDAANYPFVEVRSLALSGAEGQIDALIEVRIKDSRLPVSTQIELIPENNRLTAQGTLRLSQRAFGIEPFSTLGGALAVADELGSL